MPQMCWLSDELLIKYTKYIFILLIMILHVIINVIRDQYAIFVTFLDVPVTRLSRCA